MDAGGGETGEATFAGEHDAADDSVAMLEEAEAEAAAAAIFEATYGVTAVAQEANAESMEGVAVEDEGARDPDAEDEDDDAELAVLEAAAIAQMTQAVEVQPPAQGRAPMLGPGSGAGRAAVKSPAAVKSSAFGKGAAAGKGPVAGKGLASGAGPAAAKSPAIGTGPAAARSSTSSTNLAAAASVTAKLVALNAQGSGIDVRTSTTLRSLEPERALEILEDLEAKLATVKNPSAFVQLAARQASVPQDAENSTPCVATPKLAAAVGLATVAGGNGLKRPTPAQPGAAPPIAKRLATQAGAGVGDSVADASSRSAGSVDSSVAATAEGTGMGGGAGGNTVKVSAAVAAKIQNLRKQGTPLTATAIRELAKAESRDALVLLQALGNRKEVGDPSRWILASLRKKSEAASAKAPGQDDAKPGAPKPAARVMVVKASADKKSLGSPAKALAAKSPAGTTPSVETSVSKLPATKSPAATAPDMKSPIAKKPVLKPPAAKAPVTKAPVAKAPVAKAPVAKGPAAKVPVAKAPGRPQGTGHGKPPQVRAGLEFEQLAVQAKLQVLNKGGIWSGPHPLDDATLDALLKLDDPQRALEILDEAEELGADIKDPSQHVQKAVEDEVKNR